MERAWTALALVGSLMAGCAQARDERVLGELSASEAMSLCEDLAARVLADRGDPEQRAAEFCTWSALSAVIDQRAVSCTAERDACIERFRESFAEGIEMGTGAGCPAFVYPAGCSATVDELVRCSEEANAAYRELVASLSCDEIPASADALHVPIAPECAWMYEPACTAMRIDTEGEAP